MFWYLGSEKIKTNQSYKTDKQEEEILNLILYLNVSPYNSQLLPQTLNSSIGKAIIFKKYLFVNKSRKWKTFCGQNYADQCMLTNWLNLTRP